MKKLSSNSTTIQYDKAPKIAIHVEMDQGAILSSRLTLSDTFVCTGAEGPFLEWIHSYLQGKSASLSLSSGTPFQREVLEALQEVPFGSTVSYKELALLAGYPNAFRAVGTVCNKNPFPLFAPCHRVIQANGKIGGFALDLEIKRRLLEFEASLLDLPQ